MSLRKLATEMRSLRKRIPKQVNRITKQVATEALKTLAQSTPVDTSKALSNWQVGIGSPESGTVDAKVPGLAGSTQSASVAATVSEGKSKIDRRNVGQPIHLTNNLPYIEGLNDGTISQQPSGFVQKAIAVGNSIVRKAKIK